MNFLTKFSLKNAVAIFLIVVMIVAGGVYSTGKVKQEAMPNISIPLITTTTLYIGAAPEDVADRISRPLQKAMSGIQGVKSVKTISNENVSIIITEFGYSKDMDQAKTEIEDAINKVSLPDNAQKPITSKISMGGFPIMTYSIESTMDINELTKFAKDKVQAKLSGVTGVSNIEIQGSQDKKVYIKLDSEKLSKNNLTIQDIQNTLAANNITIPAGQVTAKDLSMTVKISNKVMSINELKAIPFIVLPNQTKLISEGMGKITTGMAQLGSAVGELGSTVGQIGSAVGTLGQSVAQEGKGMQQLGQLLSSNTQAIALLNMIQKYQAYILTQQVIIYNPVATQEQKVIAGEAIKQGQAMLQGAQQGLDKLITEITKSSSTSGSKNTNTTTTMPKPTTASQNASNGKTINNSGMSSSISNGTGSSSGSNSNKGKAAGIISTKADENQKISIKTIFLKDIASIYTGNDTQNFYTRADLKQGIILRVYKNDDANTVAIAKDIRNALDELEKANKNVKFNKIEDSSDTVKESVNGMVKEGLLGALFAVVVIALFLRDIRATIIAVISIPLSILMTLILLPMLNITINIVTLAGITVAIGRIVDDSIVVIENIYRRSSLGDDNEDREKLVESAAREVSSAITSSTITTVAVFLPLAFVSGLVGKFFVPFAITVVICMIASLLVAITVVPVMCKSIIKKGKHHKHKHHKNSKIVDLYIKILAAALKRKAIVITSSLVLMVIAALMVSKIGVQFMPADTTSVLEAKMNLAPGTSVQVTNKQAMKFEKYLMENPDVKTVVSTVGDNTGTGSGNGMVLNIQGSNSASFTIVLKDEIDYDEAARKITEKAKEFTNENQSIAIRTISTTGQRDNFNIIVKGDNRKDITTAAKMITNSLRGEKNFTNLTNNLADKKKEISVEIDNVKAAKKGFTPLVVAGLVRGMMTDNSVMTIKDNGKDMDIQLGFKEKDINSVEKVENLKVSILGISFKLSEVARVTENYGPVSISELDGNQYASISADVNGNDTQTIATNAMKKVDAIKDKLPSTTTYELGGSSKDIQEGFSQMGASMAIAVLLVYIVMMLAFGEATAPFAILFSLPFAVIGAIFALYFTGESVTLPTLVGMLMLIGIVVTNAIVLLDRVQKNRKKGMDITEALLEAGSIRLRPIFMTAIATVMALMPLSLGFSKGTVLSQGLGIVVIGGLTLSTLLTLIIVPVIYASLEGIKERRIRAGE